MSRTAVGDKVRLFGIRHHGPGSARSLIAALDDWQPDVVLVEGPAEIEHLVPHLLDQAVQPPVAMLLYAADTPRWAAYYPMADFSPELQAFRWAADHRVPIKLMDLPCSATLGMDVQQDCRSEAIEQVAEAAGFDDVEDWWEHLVEQRADPRELFQGIAALMSALRDLPTAQSQDAQPSQPDGRQVVSATEFEAAREAHMRRALRQALADDHERVAVVCGAWHVPALTDLPTAKADDTILKGLPKVKVGATVVPWTFDRLTFRSGYGAGTRSPAFYDLLWRAAPEEVPTRWLLSVAKLMREEDLDASPASVIEAVRLADALASLRGRPRPGLRELCDAAGAVLVQQDAVWNLISQRLIVGDRMGQVPDSVPMIPLQSDLYAQQKRLRMKVDDTERVLELDLRGEMDLERSHLLHRMVLLGVGWGETTGVSGKKGTFHENWRVCWRPELAISLIEASVYGNTVQSAATSKAVEAAGRARSLSEVAALIEQVLLADLQDAVEPVVAALQALSATSVDIAELAAALPPLAAVVRYGSVRRTESSRVVPVLDGIYSRLCVGLPHACVSLDDDAADAMMRRLNDVTAVVRLFDDNDKSASWLEAMTSLALSSRCHTLVVGKAERIRFDMGAVDGAYLALRLGQEASSGATASETASFIKGLLDGPGAILLHQDNLFRAVDTWLTGLDSDTLDETLPLIRRTFSLFTKPERRQIGEKIVGRTKSLAAASDIDGERARRVLPVLRKILGLPHE